MADRNRSDRDQQDHDFNDSRQYEQFDDQSGQHSGYNDQDQWSGNRQMGDSSRGGTDFYYEEVILVPRRTRSSRPNDDRMRDRNYSDRDAGRHEPDREYRSRGSYGGYGRPSGYGPSSSPRMGSFTSEDQGGRDFTQPRGRWSSRYGGPPSGRYESDYGGGAYSRPQYSDRQRERDWWDRTTDEVASWFGDEDASRRRDMDHREDHRGRGPSDYTRSDERIREDVSDNLTDDWAVDARQVRVKVENGEVTLDGTVSTRLQKRRAEDCAEDVTGVCHVQNNLRIGDTDVGNSAAARTSASKTG